MEYSAVCWVAKYSPRVWPANVLELTVVGVAPSTEVTILPLLSPPTLKLKVTPASKFGAKPKSAFIVPVPPLARDRVTEYVNISPAFRSYPEVLDTATKVLFPSVSEFRVTFGLWFSAPVPLSSASAGVFVTLIFNGVRLLFLT